MASFSAFAASASGIEEMVDRAEYLYLSVIGV